MLNCPAFSIQSETLNGTEIEFKGRPRKSLRVINVFAASGLQLQQQHQQQQQQQQQHRLKLSSVERLKEEGWG